MEFKSNIKLTNGVKICSAQRPFYLVWMDL